MAGLVGGGGIGNLAIQYGYYRFETGVMVLTVLVLIAAVQLGQAFGDRLAAALDRRYGLNRPLAAATDREREIDMRMNDKLSIGTGRDRGRPGHTYGGTGRIQSGRI